MSLEELRAIFRRRKASFLSTAMAVFLLVAVIAVGMPPVYRSSAIVLVEAQEIPADFVMTTVTSYVEQRVQAITQRILNTSSLLEIIDDIGLFAEIREKATTEELVGMLQNHISVQPISVDTVDPRTGRPKMATGAIEFSFEGGQPRTVQRVTDTLVNKFLQANLQTRQRQTAETTAFLKEEMQRVKLQLETAEAKLAAFKGKHFDALPEMLPVNHETIGNLENQIARAKDQLRSLQEREGYLQTQLASMPHSDDNLRVRLQQLEIELVNLKTKFTDAYPDVRKLKQEIEELKHQRASGSKDGRRPDNTAYVTLASQLSSTRAEIASLRRQIGEMDQRVVDFRKRLEKTPQVEETYNALLTERNNTHAKYTDLMRKAMEADVAHGLEKEQKGERFTLIEPAQFPEKPIRPNRMAILVIGLVLAVSSGMGVVALREVTDTSVHGPDDLVTAGIIPLLATIPLIQSDQGLARTRKRRRRLWWGSAVCMLLGVVLFHFLVMEIDLLWILLKRRLTI